MIKVLDLFCCGGGASMGFHQAGCKVTGVDKDPQKHYPFEFIQADVMGLTTDFLAQFDLIFASPPCQRYSVATPDNRKASHPDLIDPVRDLLNASAGVYR